MQEPKAKAKARDDGGGGGGGRRANEGLEGIQENLRIATEAKRELEGIEERREEIRGGGRGGRGGPRRGGVVRERRKRFEGGEQMQAEISKKIELIEESEYSESGNEGPRNGSWAGTPIPAEVEEIPERTRGVHRRGGKSGRHISSGRVKVAQAYDAVSASMRGKIHKDVATMVECIQSVETQTTNPRNASTGIEKGELDSLANEKRHQLDSLANEKRHHKRVKVIRSIFEPFEGDWYDDTRGDNPLALAGRRSKSPVPTSRRYPPSSQRTPTPRNREMPPHLAETPPPVTTKRVIAGMERPDTANEIYERERDDDSPKQQVSVTDHFDTLLATIEAEEEEAKKRRMQRKKEASVAADREIKKLGIDFDNRLAPSVAAAREAREAKEAREAREPKKAAAAALQAQWPDGRWRLDEKTTDPAGRAAAVAAAAAMNPAAGAASRGKQPRRTFLLMRVRQTENESGISYHVSRNQPRYVALRIPQSL